MENKTIITLSLALLITVNVNAQKNGCDWLRPVNFSVSEFSEPAVQFAPFTRWWWPGGDVDSTELKREIKLFATNHFGGVEVQPTSMVMPAKGKGRADRIMSFDTPAYYDNLKAMIREAARYGLTVDMTDGSGWPSGGAHITEEDNNLTLEYGMTDIPQGNSEALVIPRSEKGDRPNAKLVAVLAAKVKGSSGTTVILDSESVQDITVSVQDSTVSFTPETDGWKLISLWSMADMEKPMIMASRNPGFAMNHFDSTKVAKNYEHYFGERTGLKPYRGTTLRSIFNDSYEFRADRHWADGFIETFKQGRGYDPTTLLPANIWYGYNDMYQRMANPDTRPAFSFSDQDWRLRYDYDLTVSDLIRIHLLKASHNWAVSRGMVHRSQTYGLNMDMIGAAGDASIPEMETMLFSKASETGYKIISSGAHLYNRPIVSCETAVYSNRAFLTTPQKLKMTIDKVLVSGVNQIIWHGTPYSYFPEGYPKEGWYPFWNSALNVNFSTMLSETNPFWKYISDINHYAQRAQYILRSGKSDADVLIYYPFLKYSPAGHNPKELLLHGYIPDVEPSLAESTEEIFEAELETKWVSSIQQLIDELNANGVTWDWVNDESIQVMTVDGQGQMNVRGNNYKALILFDLPYIQLESAKCLEAIAQQGGNLLTVGGLPSMQPSYNNWQENDRITSETMKGLAKNSSVTSVKEIGEINSWIDGLDMPIRNIAHNDCMRQTRRLLDDGSVIQMLWNESWDYSKVSLQLSNDYKYAYWMNAEDGSITAAEIDKDGSINRDFYPLGTAFLYCSVSPINLDGCTQEGNIFCADKAEEITTVDSWIIKVDETELTDMQLGDWRNNDSLKYIGSEAVYSSSLTLDKKDKKAAYFLDLGSVYYGAEVTINGQDAGKWIYAPFIFDVTDLLHKGTNDITVSVTPSKYNEFVKRGIDGDRLFKRLKDSELAAEGMAGPVRLYKQR